MSEDDQMIRERALREKEHIESLQKEKSQPFLHIDRVKEIQQQLDLANVYNIREANRRGLL